MIVSYHDLGVGKGVEKAKKGRKENPTTVPLGDDLM
jgi:hypothetical protein